MPLRRRPLTFGRGQPQHPRALLQHACIRQRFSSGVLYPQEFQRGNEYLRVDPSGRLIVTAAAADMSVSAAVAGLGIVFLFEAWLRPTLDSGLLVPVLQPRWHRFSGPFLYYPSRRLMPARLRAFVDFIKGHASGTPGGGVA